MRSPTDAFDELAALFLTEDPDAAAVAPAVLPAVQLLVVGNAPVMAGLWLAQYADLLGRQSGPTALVRFDETEVSLEILRAGGRRVGLDGSPTLREAIRSAARVVERWIVRADPRLPLPSLLNAGADQIVLMTGADEAAIVAAYRTVKEIAEGAAERGEQAPALGLCVVGAPPERVAHLVERLNRTAAAFLGMEIALVASLQRMEPLDSAGQVAFPRTDQEVSASPTLGEVLDWVHDATLENSRRLERVEETPSRARPRPAAEPVVRVDRVDATPSANPLRPSVIHADLCAARTGPGGGHEHASRAAVAASAPAAAPPPSAPMSAAPEVTGQELASAIGLRPLPLRCPEQPTIELAVDAGGRLCLVGLLSELSALFAAEGWARRHRDLLGLAFAMAGCNAAEPELHAVTEIPADAAPLLGTRLHLHVRAPVRGPQGLSWYVAPLNRPESAR